MQNKPIPDWMKFLVTILGFVVTITLAWAKLDAKVEIDKTQHIADILRLDERTERYEKDVSEIKALLLQEMERHHPRQ